MISVEKLLYRIDQELNKLSTNEQQSIAPEDKILAIRSSQITLIKQKVGLNNNYQMGLDAFKKRYQDLQNLIVPFKKGKLDLKLTDKNLNKYSSSVQKDLLFYIDSYVLGSKGNCKDVIIYTNPSITKHSDITEVLTNNTYKPSFEWREVPPEITADYLSYYTDGTFTLSSSFVSYLRYPVEVDIEGYIKFDGTPSKTVDCELNEYLEDELLSLIVLNLALNTANDAAAQSAQIKGKLSE